MSTDIIAGHLMKSQSWFITLRRIVDYWSDWHFSNWKAPC